MNLSNQSTFMKKVYIAVQKIPRGSVRSYREIAWTIGSPRAARAVGTVLKKNKNPDVPCHRVIKSDGRVGGYNRGSYKKMIRLQEEGVSIDRETMRVLAYKK